MRTSKWLAMTALCVAAMVGTANAASLTISLNVVGDPAALGPGDAFELQIFAQTDTANGIKSVSFTVYTPDQDGMAVPEQEIGGFPPGPTGKVKHSFQGDVGGYSQFKPIYRDYDDPADPDGDLDADMMGLADITGGNANFGLGVGAPTLIATQQWKMVGSGAALKLWIDPVSTYYDASAPGFTSEFDEVVGQGLIVGQLAGGQLPSADAGPDMDEDDWSGPPPWNADGRQITVTGVGEDNDGDTQALTFEWMIEDHTGAQYGPLVDEGVPPPGEQNTITFSIGQLRNLGFPLPDPLGGPRDDYLYPLHLTVTDQDGSATDTAQIYIPEPGTMALLGLGALALIRRRRQA